MSVGRAGAVSAGARGHGAADEILLLRQQLLQPEIMRRSLAVQLRPGGMAFLDAHDAQSLGAIGRDAVLGPCLHQLFRQCLRIARGHGNLISTLAGEGDAEQPRGHAAAHSEFPAGHVGEGFVGNIKGRIDNLRQRGERISAPPRRSAPIGPSRK